MYQLYLFYIEIITMSDHRSRLMKKLSVLIIIALIFSACASNKAIHKSPDDKKADLHYEHGTKKLVERDYTIALKHFLSAVKLRSDDTKIHNNLGMTYWFKKQPALAVQHLKKSIELDEENSDARNNLASIYFKQGKYDLALLEYRNVAKNLVYPHQYRTYYNIALIFEKKQDQEQMLELLGNSLKENYDYCPSHFKLGRHYYDNKRYEKALDHFHQSSLGTCVQNPAPFFWKAKTLGAQKRYFKAKQEYRSLIKQFPQSGYSRRAMNEITALKKQELLSERMREQNYRFRGNRKSLQSKKDEVPELDLETPDF